MQLLTPFLASHLPSSLRTIILYNRIHKPLP
jgi:hypothetical protein